MAEKLASFATPGDAKMDINIVEILNTGVTGFAFLLLFLGYRLISKVYSQILAHEIGNFKSIDFYREWKSLMLSQLAYTIIFIVFSLLFFSGGLWMLMYQAESEIILSITPVESSSRTRVRHQGDSLKLKNGLAMIRVKDEHNIGVSIAELIKQEDQLRSITELEKIAKKDLIIGDAGKSSDSGF